MLSQAKQSEMVCMILHPHFPALFPYGTGNHFDIMGPKELQAIAYLHNLECRLNFHCAGLVDFVKHTPVDVFRDYASPS